MKKAIFAFILLLLAGGAVFFVGWIQLLIPPGTYAVIHTKTNGFDKEVLESGVFAWRVERLLPTNMTIYKFDLKPIQVSTATLQGSLPSAETYSAVFENKPDFSYRVRLSITFTFQPAALPSLVASEELRPDSLDSWYKQKSDMILQSVARYITQEPARVFEADAMSHIKNRLSQEPEYESLDIRSIVPLEIKMPDPDLYHEAKRQYFSIAKAREIKDVLTINQEKQNLKVLKDYAELLTQYPVLMQYLYLKELKGDAPKFLDLNLPDVPFRGE